MRYFLGKNGLEHMTQTPEELTKLFAHTNESGDTPTDYNIEELLDSANILFKHPSVSIEELCELTGDNGTSYEVCFKAEQKAKENAEDWTMVICFVDAEKHHRYEMYTVNVHYMNLATFRLESLFRKRMIDDVLPTL